MPSREELNTPGFRRKRGRDLKVEMEGGFLQDVALASLAVAGASVVVAEETVRWGFYYECKGVAVRKQC